MRRDIPLLEYDDDSDSVVLPHKCDLPRGVAMPRSCVFTFFQTVIDGLLHQDMLSELMEFKSEHGFRPVYGFEFNSRQVALFSPGVGAPLAAKYLELLIAQGCEYFIVLGACGVLDPGLEMGDLVIPVSAVRDEGTSFHYLPPGREVEPSLLGISAIEQTFEKHGLAYQPTKTWTTDGYYRETRNKIRKRFDEGCRVVEMEAAALFAVAQYRNVHLAQMMYSGDDVSGDKWQNRNWDRHYDLRNHLTRIAAEASLRLADLARNG